MVCAIPESLPRKQVGILLLLTLAEAVSNTFLFPIVPFLVEDFGVSVEDIG